MSANDTALPTQMDKPEKRNSYFFGAYFFWHWAEGFQTVLFSWYIVAHAALAPSQVGFFQSLVLLPYLVFIPFGGWFSHRFGPRVVYLVATILFAGTLLVYGPVDQFLGFNPAIFGLYCIAAGIFSAVANPAIDTFIPESGRGSTERNNLEAATIHNIAKLTGTVTTALVLGFAGTLPGFMLNGMLILLAFMFFFLFTRQLTRQEAGQVKKPADRLSFGTVVLYLRQDAMAFDTILSSTFLGLFMAPIGFVLWPLIVRENFPESQNYMGIVFTMFWIGSIISTKCLSRIIDGLGRRVTVAFGLWASAMTIAIFVYFLPSFPAMCVGVFVYGLALSPAKAIIFGLFLARIPVTHRAVLISFDKAAFWGMATFGIFIFGTSVGLIGMLPALLINAGLFFSGLALLSARRNIRIS